MQNRLSISAARAAGDTVEGQMVDDHLDHGQSASERVVSACPVERVAFDRKL